MSEDGFNVGRVAEAVDRADDAMFDALNTASSYLAHEGDNAILIEELRELTNRVRQLIGGSQVKQVEERTIHFGEEAPLSAGGEVLERLIERIYQDDEAQP